VSWQTDIDARLVARLLRTRRPGLIGTRVARRIVGAVELMAGRLPLLARFPRLTERSRAGETAIVHALPMAAPAAKPGVAAGASRPERNAAPERAIQVVAAGAVKPERNAAPERAIQVVAAGAVKPERNAAPERAIPVVTAHVVERERRIERTIVELVAPASSPPPPPQVSNERAAVEPDSHAEAMRPTPEPPSRRSRMGAPLVKAPLLVVSPVVARRTHPLANQPVPPHAPGQIPRAPSIRAAGSSQASASPVVTPRLATPSEPAGPAAPGGRRLVLLRPTEVAGPGETIVSPRRAPVQRAGAALAHIAPAPVVAVEAARTEVTPPAVAQRALASPASPSARASAAASPISQPLQRTDLPEIAVQVKRIMERQALHDRARRGLRR
jgi:hypothetical protein